MAQSDRDAERPAVAWALEKPAKRALCEVWSHARGFEVRLKITGDLLQRTALCPSRDNVIATCTAWKLALIETGWSAAPVRGDDRPLSL